MKEFEKWWENFNRVTLPADEFDFARLAWRAALEWVLTREQTLYFTKSLSGDVRDSQVLGIVETPQIDRELSDE